MAQSRKDTSSIIQTVDIHTRKIDTVLTINAHFEAPNWHPDGYLLLNSYGRIQKLDLQSKKLSLLNTGFATQCNNDHGISFDQKWLIISNNYGRDTSSNIYGSTIFKLPVTGGTPVRITSEVPSYWHGIDPSGETIAYCAERNGNYDVYTMGINGGVEKRQTETKGLDDGPEYSPDGRFIYFNSYRTGHMQIWRMLADGTKPEQLTSDQNSNWFPHPSPDGKYIVFIAYTSDQKQDHLFGKEVKLRLMDLSTRKITDLTKVFYGGQGTINVPSWSPDSQKLAFVSYLVK